LTSREDNLENKFIPDLKACQSASPTGTLVFFTVYDGAGGFDTSDREGVGIDPVAAAIRVAPGQPLSRCCGVGPGILASAIGASWHYWTAGHDGGCVALSRACGQFVAAVLAMSAGLVTARHLIENFFAKLKQFRAIATRYDKTARNFLGAVYLTACTIWLN
jgi:hypothetical protein